MKINFITFANSDSNFSQERIIFEAKRMDIFSDITFYTEKDFDEEFLKRIGEDIKNFKRGYGYWSWKPFIIKKELEKLDDGDVVVYADSGCMFLRKNRKTLKEWVNIAKNSESGILSPCYGPYIEHDWTRGDLYDYINKTYNKNNVDIFDKAIQCGCGVSLYCKNEKCVDFVNQWYDIMTNHFHLCTDEPSTMPNHPNFKENRHDQSVFSMLSKIYGIETIETSKGILDKEHSPIIATRCKNDASTWVKPIDVLFDGQIYELQKFGGISKQYSVIADELNKNEIVDRYTGSGIASGKYQDYYARFSIGNTKNEYLKDVYCDEDSEASFKMSVNELKEGDFDVFYPTFFSPYFLEYIGNKPFVMSVHDMIPEIYEEFFNRNDLQIVGKRKLVQYAAAIEVPTECTKKDLIRILGVDESKIRVIGRALSPNFGEKFYSESIVDYEYILYVGQRNAYKRFDWFVKHISKFLKKHKDVHLICTGNEFSEKEKELLKKYGIKSRAHTIFADEITMATLYKYAKFFVFSSEYEGFGLPVLESYKMGCIALLNDTEVFREITDNLGTFFEMSEKKSNLSEVAEKVYSLSYEERNNILNKQYTILEKHSFEKYINNVKSMLNEVVGNNKTNKKKGKVNILICTHKPFNPIVSNDRYKIINCNAINNDTWNGLKGSFYSEIMSYFYIYENYELNEYIGFCHYRKYFAFKDDIPDMDEIFSKYDVIAASPLILKGTIKEQYITCHNIEDLYIVGGILAEKYPQYTRAWQAFINGNILFPYNMFIMKKEDFAKYITFVKGVLDEYVKIVGTDIYKRIGNNIEKYLKSFKPNDSIDYQYRIGGYLAERLTSLYLMSNFKNIKAYEVIITEEKYK